MIRWDDDVVFKNCARQDKPKVGFYFSISLFQPHATQTHEFVNDSLRTDFHRKFMSKYIK